MGDADPAGLDARGGAALAVTCALSFSVPIPITVAVSHSTFGALSGLSVSRFLARGLDLPEGQGARAARMLALVFALSAGLSLI